MYPESGSTLNPDVASFLPITVTWIKSLYSALAIDGNTTLAALARDKTDVTNLFFS